MYRGDIRLEDTIDVKFTTRSFTTGAPTTLAGSPVISAYVGNSVTQITAGITLSVDFDTVMGLHNVRIVATAANGYTAATNIDLVITTGTVGGVSVVGEVIGSFSIEARSALMPTTAARKLDVSTGGEAGVDWANVGSPTTTLALTGTTIAVTQKVDVETIKTNPVVNGGTVTFPTNATLASTTNITSGVITTVTTVTNQLTAAAIATGVWQDTTAGDFTVALSIGKSIMNGVALGTGLTVARCTLTDTLTTYTGNTVQTGDSFALANGANGFVAIKADTAAILVDTGTTLDGRIPAALVGGRMDSSVGAMAANTLTASALAADAVDEIWDEVLGTALTARAALLIAASGGLGTFSINDAGASTTVFITDLTSAVDDFYRDMQLTFTSGALSGQIRVIASYNGTTKTVTLDEALTSAPANGVTFVVSGPHTHTTTAIGTAVWASATRTLTAGTNIQLPSNGLANVTAWTVAITGNVTGNLSGSVGSVSGAVGSVTGAVGSVTGAVGSVTGAVGSVTGNVGGNVTGSVGSVVGAVGSVTGLTASNLDTTVSSRLATAGYTAPPTAAQNATAVLTTQMAESYAANGVAPTLAQAMFGVHQYLMDFTISSTSYTVKKLDNATTAFIVTLNSATTPTAAART